MGFLKQDYAAPLQMICGVQECGDPAVEVVEAVMRKASADGALAATINLRVDGLDRGSNRKVSNLLGMISEARHDLLVVADSDIEVSSHYLNIIVAHLQTPGVGAVTCLFHGVASSGFWSKHAALGINVHYLPGIILALSFKLATPCFGSTIALRKRTLEQIGGFEAFSESIADDYAIGHAVRSAGYKVAVPPITVGHRCIEGSFSEIFLHELRIARTIKSLRPLCYCGTIIAHPFPLALIGALCGLLSGGHLLLLAVAALCCRAALCRCVAERFGLEPQPYWLIPLRDLLAFVVYVASFSGTSVVWRGFNYEVGAGGKVASGRN